MLRNVSVRGMARVGRASRSLFGGRASSHLCSPSSTSAGVDMLAVIDDLVGLHATGALSPYLQRRTRKRAFAAEEPDEVLDAGAAARVGCMRRTLFIESARLVPIVFAATRELTVCGRERYLAANGLSERRYEELAARVAEALVGRALDARELRDAIGSAERLSAVILVMCDEGRVVRWKGARGWRSARPTYRRFDKATPAVRLDSWTGQAAVRELVIAHRGVRGCVEVRIAMGGLVGCGRPSPRCTLSGAGSASRDS